MSIRDTLQVTVTNRTNVLAEIRNVDAEVFSEVFNVLRVFHATVAGVNVSGHSRYAKGLPMFLLPSSCVRY